MLVYWKSGSVFPFQDGSNDIWTAVTLNEFHWVCARLMNPGHTMHTNHFRSIGITGLICVTVCPREYSLPQTCSSCEIKWISNNVISSTSESSMRVLRLHFVLSGQCIMCNTIRGCDVAVLGFRVQQQHPVLWWEGYPLVRACQEDPCHLAFSRSANTQIDIVCYC